MSLGFVQDSGSLVNGSGSPLTAQNTFGVNVTVGSALFVFVSSGASNRTYTVSDNIVGAQGWNKFADIGGVNAGAEIWGRANHPGGAVTISTTHGQSTGAFTTIAIELSGFGSDFGEYAVGTFDESPVTSNDHFSEAGSGLSISKELFSLCSGFLTSGSTQCLPGSGYTEVANASSGSILNQYRHFPSGVSNERGAWSNTGTPRSGLSCMILITGSAPASTAIPFFTTIDAKRI